MYSKKVLVIAAHPDDEILGCGGTIAKHIQKGDTVNVSILAEGATSRDNSRDSEKRKLELSQLAQAAYKAGEILGISSLSLHNLPDNRLDSCDLLDITKIIESEISKYKPEIIYTHHSGDLNIDHQRVHQSVVTAARPLPESHVKTLLFFETPSSTEWQTFGSALPFMPNWFNDISETLVLKLKALEAYESEMRSYPHPRSIEAVEYLARWRGATVGVKAAEGFILGRKLIN